MSRFLTGQRFKNWISAGFGRFSRLLFELPIIFVGVLAAFLADNYRENREAEANARQMYRGIVNEINDHRRFLRSSLDSIKLGLTSWDSAFATGSMPAPFVFRIWGSEYPPDGAWRAALSQASELREPKLLLILSAYYNEQIGISDRYVRYASFVEANVLPFRESNRLDVFYNSLDGTLKPEYRANMSRLRELSDFWSFMLPMADSLALQIERVIQK